MPSHTPTIRAIPQIPRGELSGALVKVLEAMKEDIELLSGLRDPQYIVNYVVSGGNGEAGSASAVGTGDTVQLTGDVTGTGVFDAAGNMVIQTTVLAGLASTSEYCPGYTFGYVDADTFTVDGFDVTNLFNVGRRIKFRHNGVDLFGSVTSRSYSDPDTTVNVTMESGSLANVAYTMCFTAGTAAWSPIAADPFGGSPINAIHAGLIGSTIHWIAVGNGGKIFGSTNGGLTWTAGTGYTTVVNLNDIAYDSLNEEFIVVGDDGVFLESSNGTSWTEDTTTIKALAAAGGTEHCLAVAYHANADTRVILWTRNSSASGSTYSTAGGAWTESDIVHFGTWIEYLEWGGSTRYLISNADFDAEDLYIWTTATATGLAGSIHATTGQPDVLCWAGFATGGTYKDAYGTQGGKLVTCVTGNGGTLYIDDVTTSNNVNAMAYSSIDSRFVAVTDLGEIAYIDEGDMAVVDNWTIVSNGFNTLANILDVHYNATDAIFIAVADNGQICRSTNGTN